MGYWGVQSYDNDACHDILDKLNCKDDPDAEMLEWLLTNYCAPSKVTPHYDIPKELYLGVVVWGLQHNVIVARKRLQHALKCARNLIDDQEYLKNWRRPKARKQSLQSEIDQIQKWLNLTPKEFRVQKAVGSI